VLFKVTADFWPQRDRKCKMEVMERDIVAESDTEAADLMREHLRKDGGSCSISNVTPIVE